jgi:hypothetical protein
LPGGYRTARSINSGRDQQMTLLNIEDAPPTFNESSAWKRIWRATAAVAVLSLVAVAAVPLSGGLVVGGRAAVAENLSTLGARVEDFVPEDRGKLSKPIIGGLVAGAASAVGKRVANLLVDGAWPLALAWFDRTTHKTDFMVWAGPGEFVDGMPIGRDDTLMHLKFEDNGNLALAYRLSRFFATLGLDVGKFRMSAVAERDECACSYRTYGEQILVSTSGDVHQTWRSEKKGVIANVVARMDANGQIAAGDVTTSFDEKVLKRPVVLGSRHDHLQADKRLNEYPGRSPLLVPGQRAG